MHFNDSVKAASFYDQRLPLICKAFVHMESELRYMKDVHSFFFTFSRKHKQFIVVARPVRSLLHLVLTDRLNGLLY